MTSFIESDRNQLVELTDDEIDIVAGGWELQWSNERIRRGICCGRCCSSSHGCRQPRDWCGVIGWRYSRCCNRWNGRRRRWVVAAVSRTLSSYISPGSRQGRQTRWPLRMMDISTVVFNLTLAVICGFAIVGFLLLITSEAHPTFPRLIRNRRRGFFTGTVVAFIGITLFPYTKNALDSLFL